jgi:hypothetical protein
VFSSVLFLSVFERIMLLWQVVQLVLEPEEVVEVHRLVLEEGEEVVVEEAASGMTMTRCVFV